MNTGCFKCDKAQWDADGCTCKITGLLVGNAERGCEYRKGIELKPCPFCGGEAKIQVCDDEGNFHDDEYELDAWSGLGFLIVHEVESNPNCPIAKYEGESLGLYIYNSRDAAIIEWNRRAEND